MKVIRIVVLSMSLIAFTLRGVENESKNSGGALQVDALSLAGAENQIYRLYDGIMVYLNNNDGKDFTVTLDLRDLNIFANGPREVLFKVYDPDGVSVVREVVPDDGVASQNYQPRIGGWDHELAYYVWCYSRGSQPMIRWSAWSDLQRLATVPFRRYVPNIKGGKKGVYRIQVLGDRDHYVTVKTDPDLPFAVCGHHSWLVGHGQQWKQTFIYVPKGTVGIHLGFAEPDEPRTRHFTLTAPDGKKLFDGTAAGILNVTELNFEKPGQYDGLLLTLAVSDGPNDYMMHLSLKQLAEGVFKEYVGMGSLALFARDKDTANAVMGGTFVEDGLVFWHMFQVRAQRWLKANPNAPKDIRDLFEMMRLIGPGDGRGSPTWTSLAYDFGYYGCKIWRPGWQLMARADTPKEIKDIIREAFILGGDRLSFAAKIEKCNGNAFSQINVALWYCSQATGDPLQKQLFETFFERGRSEGWGEGSGLSKSGDSQEHFAHDCNYGWYLMENWAGGIWVPNGILADTTDPRFKGVFNRYRNLYSYISCKEAAANPWSSRTAESASERWAGDKDVPWKGEPGPDFTVSVNDGNEWFAARRKNYYSSPSTDACHRPGCATPSPAPSASAAAPFAGLLRLQ